MFYGQRTIQLWPIQYINYPTTTCMNLTNDKDICNVVCVWNFVMSIHPIRTYEITLHSNNQLGFSLNLYIIIPKHRNRHFQCLLFSLLLPWVEFWNIFLLEVGLTGCAVILSWKLQWCSLNPKTIRECSYLVCMHIPFFVSKKKCKK